MVSFHSRHLHRRFVWSPRGASHPAVPDRETSAATRFVVFIRPNAPRGVAVLALAVALDGNNHPAPDYAGVANLTSSDPFAAMPFKIAFDQGLASFELTFATLGRQTVTATDRFDSSIAGTSTTDVVGRRDFNGGQNFFWSGGEHLGT